MLGKDKENRLSLTSDDYIRPLCGCDIAKGVIKYCSKHKATPKLYEALAHMLTNENVLKRIGYRYEVNKMKEALALADNK